MTIFQFDFNDVYTTCDKKQIKLRGDNFNKILNLYANLTMRNGTDENGYTVIHSSKLKATYSGYKKYIDYMISEGWIKRSYYKKGEKSYGYRLTESFKKELKIKSLYHYPSKSKQSKNNGLNISINVEPWVKKRLKADFNKCTVDYDLSRKQLEKTKDSWGGFIQIGKWFINNRNLAKLQKGRNLSYYWKSGRLYTDFTYLSSKVRSNNILLNDEKIVEFDIKSSFPLMLAKYCLNISPDIVDDHDFLEYCTSIINGDFYKDLQYRLNELRNCYNKEGLESDVSTRYLTRKETKELFQIYLNGNYKKTPLLNGLRPEINSIIKCRFPEIHKIIKDIKDNGEMLYCELVKLETELIMSIIEDLYIEYPNVLILSCHDAIYVPESFQQSVSLVWNQWISDFTKDFPRDNYDAKQDCFTEYFLEEFDEQSDTEETTSIDDNWFEEDEWEFSI